MKKVIGMFALLLLGSPLVAEESKDDPVLMKINGKNITRGEFEYAYNKNSDVEGGVEEKSVDEYVDMFVNYQLKVEAALEAQLDTLASFRKEYHTYRDMQLTPLLRDTMYIDSVARAMYDRTVARMNGADMIRPAHIFLRLPQNASEEMKNAKKAKIDSLYGLLKNGAVFADLAKTNSEDVGSAKEGGLLPWLGPNSTVKEFEDVAYSLKKGEMSAPFLSPVGYHIIYMADRKPFSPYEELRAGLFTVLKKRGIEEKAGEHAIQQMIARSGGRLTREAILDSVLNAGAEVDPDLKFLVKEYHDGLLLYEISKRTVWDVAAADTVGLEKYFKKHKKQYRWDGPRFKGFLYYTKREDLLEPVARLLGEITDASWEAAVDSAFNTDSVRNVKVFVPEYYKEGDNKYVDELVFKGDKVRRPVEYPYVNVVGEKMKRPKSYKDVRTSVLSDYQDQLEKEWVESLRRKYPVEINEDVLKTVNNHK